MLKVYFIIFAKIDFKAKRQSKIPNNYYIIKEFFGNNNLITDK